MEPFTITGPSGLLVFLAITLLLWTLASIVTVFGCLRALTFGATKLELAAAESRFNAYCQDAREARDELQKTVQTLSGEIHGVLGELRAARRRDRREEDEG